MSLTIEEQRKRLVKICDRNMGCIKCPIRIPCEKRNARLFPFLKSDKEIEEMAKEVEELGLL